MPENFGIYNNFAFSTQPSAYGKIPMEEEPVKQQKESAVDFDNKWGAGISIFLANN